MDEVFINNLTVNCTIGVLARERVLRQPLELDIEMAFDCHPAGRSDQLSDALDYANISAYVSELIENTEFKLIETVAETVASALLKHYPIEHISLSLRKPMAIATADHVGIKIKRTKHHGQ